jgi:hypothetical protein
MSSERKRRAEVVRLIVTTRERFPHTPRLMEALRRVMWRYVTPQPKPKRPRQRSAKKTVKRKTGG